MKKEIAILLGLLLIGAFGAAIVSAVASDDTKTNSFFGQMHRWGARNADFGYREGNSAYCPYLNSNNTIELKVQNVDQAFEIAKSKISSNVSKEGIYQMRRWWIVPYDNNGVSSQARIDAVTGEVYTGYSVPAGAQTGCKYAYGSGCCGRGYGRCSGY
jgi:hypothetical protein